MQELPSLAPQHLAPLALTIEEAGLVSRIGRNNIYLAIQTGALRARKLGKKHLILTDDLRVWLEGLPLAFGDTNTGTTREPAETAASPSPKRRLIAAR